MTRRPASRYGDALVTGFEARDIGAGTVAAVASCECGQATYTAVSGTLPSVRKIIYRKHRKHLAACTTQARLAAQFPVSAP
jgi:hypothetical protein